MTLNFVSVGVSVGACKRRYQWFCHSLSRQRAQHTAFKKITWWSTLHSPQEDHLINLINIPLTAKDHLINLINITLTAIIVIETACLTRLDAWRGPIQNPRNKPWSDSGVVACRGGTRYTCTLCLVLREIIEERHACFWGAQHWHFFYQMHEHKNTIRIENRRCLRALRKLLLTSGTKISREYQRNWCSGKKIEEQSDLSVQLNRIV